MLDTKLKLHLNDHKNKYFTNGLYFIAVPRLVH